MAAPLRPARTIDWLGIGGFSDEPTIATGAKQIRPITSAPKANEQLTPYARGAARVIIDRYPR